MSLYYTLNYDSYQERIGSNCREVLLSKLKSSPETLTGLDVRSSTGFNKSWLKIADQVLSKYGFETGVLLENKHLIIPPKLAKVYPVVHAYLGVARDHGEPHLALLEATCKLISDWGSFQVIPVHNSCYNGCQSWLQNIHPKYWAETLIESLKKDMSYGKDCTRLYYLYHPLASFALNYLGFSESLKALAELGSGSTLFEDDFYSTTSDLCDIPNSFINSWRNKTGAGLYRLIYTVSDPVPMLAYWIPPFIFKQIPFVVKKES